MIRTKRPTIWKGKKSYIKNNEIKPPPFQPAQRITHDLQDLLEDLLCTNLTKRYIQNPYSQFRAKPQQAEVGQKHTIMHASYLVRAAKIHALLSKLFTKQACYLYVYTFFLVTMLKYMHCSLLQVQCLCFNKQPVQFSLRSRQDVCCNCRTLDPNPIDRFRIYFESFKYLSYLLILKRTTVQPPTLVGAVVPNRYLFTYVGQLLTPENSIR